MSAYTYWGNCSSSTYEDIQALRNTEEKVSWREFRRAIPDAREKLEEMVAVWPETTNDQIEDSWFLDFYRGEHRGRPAYYVGWSGIEWIWEKVEENPRRPAISRKQEQYVVDAYKSGMSMGAIGKEIGVSNATVSRLLKRLKVETRRGGRSESPAREHLEEILAAYDAGMPTGAIAKEVSVSRETIRRWLKEAGVAMRPSRVVRLLSPEQETAVNKAYEAGATTTSIAASLGVLPGVVQASLVRQGVRRRRPGRESSAHEHTDEVVAAYESGMSMRAIANELGVSHETIRRWLKEAGVAMRSRQWQFRTLLETTDENPMHSPVLSKLTSKGTRFETGKPVRFRYMRSTDRAPFFGGRFGQDIEPAGRYLLEDDANAYGHPQDGWEYGWVEFDSPLVIPFTAEPDEPHYGPAGWKAALSRAYGGKRGQALTRAIRADGYDGVVTVWMQGGTPLYTKEVVDLGVVENPSWPTLKGPLAIASITAVLVGVAFAVRAAAMRKRRDPGPGRTSAVGNSITAARTGFVSFLDRALPSRSFDNMGVVGEGVVAIAGRLERNVIARGGYDEVIIEAGVNDIRRRDALEYIPRHLAAMVRSAKAAGLKVVLTTLPPWHQEATKIMAINQRIKDEGRNWGADVIADIHRPLADWRGHLKSNLVGDRMGLHPTREGQELIGRAILEAAYS